MSPREWIEATLRSLGVGANYRSYHRTVDAILLAVEDQQRLAAVKREIYTVIGERDHCTWSAVERNIRTVISRAWRCNRKLLIQMAGYPMQIPPTASDFLDIVTNYVVRGMRRYGETE